MRHTTTAIAAFLVAMAAAAPATACESYGEPCGPGLFGGDRHVYSEFERLPDPAELAPPPAPSRYFYVNQGPTFSGPGMYAPVPTYQERAVTGWHGYDYGYYYGYNGGPYGDATSHYYDGAPFAQGPVVYRYGPWAHRHGRVHHSLRYGAGTHVAHAVAGARAEGLRGPRIVHPPHGDRD